MTDENQDLETKEIPDENLEQISGGAMVVKPNLNRGKDGDRPQPRSDASIFGSNTPLGLADK